MKMKIIKHKFFIFIFLILLIFQPVLQLTVRLANENRFSSASKKDDFYNESYRSEGYETPRMVRHQNPEWNSSEGNMEINNLAINNNISQMTYRHNTSPIVRVNKSAQMLPRIPNTVIGIDACPCISRVKCQPCGIAPVLDFNRNSAMECPCAPKPNCPVCPPLSLIHEIASKKAQQDQQLASNLKNLSSQISKTLDMIIKHANEVINHEKEAKEAAKNMEEASMRAQIARKNMISTSEKARFIAKTSIVERKPCGPMGSCNNALNVITERAMGFYPDKVFPEEVDNIKDFMRDTFTTNINAFSLSSSEKLKGDLGSDFANPTNFLQEDETSLGSNYYNQPEGARGIDSASLNRRYLDSNQRRIPKNFIDDNDNYMTENIPRREKNENYDNNRNNINRSDNYLSSTMRKASDEKAIMKNSEVNFLMQKNIEKTQGNKPNNADNAKKNNEVAKKENSENDMEVNNHKMLRKLR